MTIQITSTTVDVLGKTYQIKCPDSEVSSLQRASDYLEEKMLEIKKINHVLSIDRIAVLAALNIAHQLLTLEREKFVQVQALEERLKNLNQKLEDALNGK